MLASLRPRWPLFAFLVSAALLAGAHAFETFGGLRPCALCLEQRERHWLILAAAAVLFAAGVVLRPRWRWYDVAAAASLGLLFLLSFVSAAHHVAVEQHWMIAQCDIELGDIHPMGASGSFDAPRCDTPQWSLFGITMAGYNGAISLAMALASFAVAAARKPT